MTTGDRVVWHSFRRDADSNFILHDAVIMNVGAGWQYVEIELLERDRLFAQKARRTVTGDRLTVRYHAVAELDG